MSAGGVPGIFLAAVTVAGLGAYVLVGGDSNLPALCGRLGAAAVVYGVWYFQEADIIAELLIAWSIMVLVMMPLLSWRTARHLWHISPPDQRWPGMIVSTIAYLAVWILSGAVLVPAFILTGFWVSESPFMYLAIALIWSATPAAQRARNLCHRRLPVRPNAVATDSFTQGIVAGVACLGVGWPVMLAAMAVADYHLVAMAAAAVYAYAEKAAHPGPPRWRFPPGPTAIVALFLASIRRQSADA